MHATIGLFWLQSPAVLGLPLRRLWALSSYLLKANAGVEQSFARALGTASMRNRLRKRIRHPKSQILRSIDWTGATEGSTWSLHYGWLTASVVTPPTSAYLNGLSLLNMENRCLIMEVDIQHWRLWPWSQHYSGANWRDLNSLVFEFERLSGGIAKIDLMLSVWRMSLLLLFVHCCWIRDPAVSACNNWQCNSFIPWVSFLSNHTSKPDMLRSAWGLVRICCTAHL